MKNLFFVFYTLLFSQNINALGAYCDGVAGHIDKTIPLPGNVDYFMRSSPNSREVSFATVDGNKILNVDSGLIRVAQGMYDPVFSPDGEILTVPLKRIFRAKNVDLDWSAWEENNPEEFDSIIFIKEKGKIRRIGKSYSYDMPPEYLTERNIDYKVAGMGLFFRDEIYGQPALFDEEISENYQSMGVLDSHQGRIRYRMLYAADDRLRIKDYDYYYGISRSLVAVGPSRPICSNYSEKALVLPMINKLGTEISAFNIDSGRTVILRINDGFGKCDEVESFPFFAGKMDFSPNNRYVAFHVDLSQVDEPRYYRRPKKENRLAAYVYDREATTLIPLQNDPRLDAYYPVFVSDNEIAMISHLTDDFKSDSNELPDYSIQILRFDNTAGLKCEGCDVNTSNGQKAALLGVLFQEKCQSGELENQKKIVWENFNRALFYFSRLSPQSCLELISAATDKDVRYLSRPQGVETTWFKRELVGVVNRQVLRSMCKTN